MNTSDTMHISHCMVRTASCRKKKFLCENDVLVGPYNV